MRNVCLFGSFFFCVVFSAKALVSNSSFSILVDAQDSCLCGSAILSFMIEL